MLKSMRLNLVSSMLLAWLAFLLLVPDAASAASVSLSQTAQTALAKHIAAAPAALKDKLNAQTASLQTIQRQETSLDDRYSTLHANNAKALDAVNQRIKLIDADKLNRMTNDLNALRTKYKPLFTLYTTVNKRIADARALKLKELTAILKQQADMLKTAVQLARAEIRIREDALSAAKAATAKTVKSLKTSLTAITSVHAQSKVALASASGTKKTIPGVVKTLNACVKSGSHAGTLQSLSSLVALSHSIVDQKTRVIEHENKIAAIINQVGAQIPVR
ncbi:hypothetical protein [Paenibacillus sacheonensis]|uniref:Uncharacterized protein n=1 Tax=Paenibacillus sacheonensis TaxID=742054 RepID=A0A7X4YTA1_9BACL|nr:hypothetical protein [Paenibacillus sacheonensis]MBM7568463.1 hypothetical protein [Paenibacillus sacheonensis]NBC72161.1 hypothetical protein [Paenibacillus sacheonensis]